MSTFGQRLTELQEHYDPGNVSAFIRRLGSGAPDDDGPRGSYYNWLKLETPTAAAMGTVLVALPEVNPQWLSTGKGAMFRDEGQGTSDSTSKNGAEAVGSPLVEVVEVDVEVSAGNGYEVHLEPIAGHVLMPGWYIRAEYGIDPERCRFVRVRGSSMEPTLMPGQRILVGMWRGETLRDGWVYVLYGPGGLQVKRLFFEPEHIHIWSDNPDAPRFRVPLNVFDLDYHVVAAALEVNRKL